jgi:8-oxo-dGTP pyrophosphatase MutT (NUDIX family)
MPTDDRSLLSADGPPAWLAALRARGDQPPAVPRDALCIGTAVCGSIEPALALQLQRAGLPLQPDGARWSLTGPPDAALEQVARWLHANGHGGRWRDERLAVGSDSGEVHAMVERAAVRALGIATKAVHLVGTTRYGEVWVQQRALDKAVDPGLLDTLVGGLAAEGETTLQTLERETWEEAGLRLAELEKLTPLGRLTVRRPVSDGYMVEHLEMFEARVPDANVPANQDGEVMGFARMDLPALMAAVCEQRFTLEAALIHAHWREFRTEIDTPQTGGHPVVTGRHK